MRRRYRKTRRRPFKVGSERELCDLLIADAERCGFRAVPECGGWDLIIVAPTGEQVGVQAKLRPNIEVLSQVITTLRQAKTSPDVAAVLVPSASDAFVDLCRELGVYVFEGATIRHSEAWNGVTWWHSREALERGRRRDVSRGRCWVPTFDVDLPAGVPAPKTITAWKVSAVRLCARLRAGEELTLADFTAEGVNMRTWVARGWMVRSGSSRPARYALGPAELPDATMPEIVEAVRRAGALS